MKYQLTVYLPSLTNISSDNDGLQIYRRIQNDRIDLVEQLAAHGYRVEDINGIESWVKNMMDHAQRSHAFIFPPMTSLAESHPNFQAEAAQRWFEFFSLVTGIHVGSAEKFNPNGKAKPCVIIDPDGQWKMVTDLLSDLHEKGMFSSKFDDIVHVIQGSKNSAAASLNKQAVEQLNEIIDGERGKPLKMIRSKYGLGHTFDPFRNDVNGERHHFGVAMFGSATTKEKSYIDASHELAKQFGQRGWRISTGAGTDGCMGAIDRGFNVGKKEFHKKYPNAPYKPAHIGVSTQSILRLEGPPDHLDQLIVTDDIYDRMRIMIKGRRSEDSLKRARDTSKVIIVVPGGTGTLHEFATLMQLATHGTMMEGRKVILLNQPSHLDKCKGFWDPLIATAKKLGFDNLFEVASSVDEAVRIADQAYSKWLERHPENSSLPHPVFNPKGTAEDNPKTSTAN